MFHTPYNPTFHFALATMMILRKKHYGLVLVLTVILLGSDCYEKTLRKIVRNQSKMVQTPFSTNNADFVLSNKSNDIVKEFMLPRYTEFKSVVHKMQRPKMSTILSSINTGRSKSMFSRMNIQKNEIVHPYELRMARDAITNALRQSEDNLLYSDRRSDSDTDLERYSSIPISRFFSSLEESKHDLPSPKESLNLVPDYTPKEKSTKDTVTGISVMNETNNTHFSYTETQNQTEPSYNLVGKPDFATEEAPLAVEPYNASEIPYICSVLQEANADIDAQQKYSRLDIEPPWMIKRQFWNQIYDSRYESLMRCPKWPPLKVILIPRSQVHTVWKESFESLHNDKVHRIISNVVKKLQFYRDFTFSWNEVSHLSLWWKETHPKNRAAVRRLIKEGRLEITSGTWVETDESTSHLFGIIHQLIEGHQWLQHNLNYSPDVAWFTSSVTHSSTLPYLLSAAGISNLIITNLHYSWQQFLAEYQYADFIWVQNWDHDRATHTTLNQVLKKIGHDRYPKHSILTHYLQFNSAGFQACGPQGEICATEFNFANINDSLDISIFNVKEKSERLLEQYSKTGTTSTHNVIVAPIGDSFHYQFQTELDYQYNNYNKIAEFINNNGEIYKTSVEFGTSNDYFNAVMSRQTSISTLKGDFLNFADIRDGSPAYWTGVFTSRPQLKILLRRLQSTLRSTEILFSFALHYDTFKTYNATKLFELLLNAREVVARLQDYNVVAGTLTSRAIRYVHSQILNTTKDCWRIQEVATSLLSSKGGENKTYLEKYVYKDGEFMSSFKSVAPGDHIYIFNSLNQERSEVVELITRHPNVRLVDHKENEVTVQVNPVWKFNFENTIKVSKQLYKIIFVVTVPPLTLELFKIKNSFRGTQSASTVYCEVCNFERVENFSFDVHPIEEGDIQIENYKHRLIFDEHSGFLKSVTHKSTNSETVIIVDFGAFRSSNKYSGMFLFNTNYSKPLEDVLSPHRKDSKLKTMIIISGKITTELISIYGDLLQHSVKIFNLVNTPLSDAIKFETKLDYGVSPKNRELEIFMSIQTDIANGSPPELTIDNNGFQYTSRTINLSRRVESNMYPMTSMMFIQDHKRRLTVVTDHTQGVTALQEGQVVVMLDRRVLFDDRRGSEEGLADSSATFHNHYILLENYITPTSKYDKVLRKNDLKLPSPHAIYLSHTLDYLLDVFLIDITVVNCCHFVLRPLIKKSFPCDVSLINYRIILNRGNPANYSPNVALMTLHRQSFSCFTDQEMSLRCSGEEQLILDKMFHKIKGVYQTNLVGTNEGVLITSLNRENLPPMEITTLRIYF